jgi:hypothetical protein
MTAYSSAAHFSTGLQFNLRDYRRRLCNRLLLTLCPHEPDKAMTTACAGVGSIQTTASTTTTATKIANARVRTTSADRLTGATAANTCAAAAARIGLRACPVASVAFIARLSGHAGIAASL